MTAMMMTIVGLPASRSRSANDRSTGFAAWLLTAWLALGSLCAWNGRYDARCIMAGRSAAPTIRVETAGASAFPRQGTLIAHMNGRHFIWGRTKSEKQPRAYVVLDGSAPSVSLALPTH